MRQDSQVAYNVLQAWIMNLNSVIRKEPFP